LKQNNPFHDDYQQTISDHTHTNIRYQAIQ